MAFDFAPLMGRCPAPAVKWPGWPKYDFTFGNNAAEEVPIDDLRAAVDKALRVKAAGSPNIASNRGRRAIGRCGNSRSKS